MLLKLEVYNDLPEITVLQLGVGLGATVHLEAQLLPGHLLRSLAKLILILLPRAQGYQISDALLQDDRIVLFIHLLEYFLPHPIFNLAVLHRV